jgi:hypothetical protein
MAWYLVQIDSPDSDGELSYGPYHDRAKAEAFADRFNAIADRREADNADRPHAYVGRVRPARMRLALYDWSVGDDEVAR